MIITIGGTPGSGKSTVAKKLARILKYPRLDLGGMKRGQALQHGMTLAEFNRRGERDRRFDAEIDDFQKKLGRTRAHCVVEGRLSFHFIPHALKIFLSATPRIGAQRIFRDVNLRKRKNEERGLTSLRAIEASIRRRMLSDRKRFKRYYRIDPFVRSHYDFFLDTSGLSEQEVYSIVLKYVVDKLQSRQQPRKKH